MDREKERFYNRNIIDCISSALIITDPMGKITDLNIPAEKLTGYTQDELIDAPFQNYFVDPKKALESIVQVITGGGCTKQKLIVRTKSGVYRIVVLNGLKVYDQQGMERCVFTAPAMTSK